MREKDGVCASCLQRLGLVWVWPHLGWCHTEQVVPQTLGRKRQGNKAGPWLRQRL